MDTTTPHEPDARLAAAVVREDAATRLRAALAIGTRADARFVPLLVARCAVEPDFFVRDMLTWALCRLPADTTVPVLLGQLGSDGPQARSQALHTLSKIGDGSAWPAVTTLLHDGDDDVARSAWRAAVALVPDGDESALAVDLGGALGRGDPELQLSLGRALAALGEAAAPVLREAMTNPDPAVRRHAEAVERLRLDPDGGFGFSRAPAARELALRDLSRGEPAHEPPRRDPVGPAAVAGADGPEEATDVDR